MRDVSTLPQPPAGDERQASAVISLVIIEDNRLLREGLCEFLARQTDFRIVGAAADFSVINKLSSLVSPAVLLLDVGLNDDDSLAICRAAGERFPALRVIVMGMAPHQDDIASLVQAGAVGFIRKDAASHEFATTIRHVAGGASALPRVLTESLFSEIVRQPQQIPAQVVDEGTRLTAREWEVITLLGEGLSNKEIASRLHIAIHTVKSHVHNVLEKLSLHSRLEVAVYSRSRKGHT